MATSYTGLRVQDTYNAIIKIGDNSNLSGTAKLLSDGLGNDSPLYLSGTRLGIGITPAYQFHTSGNAKIGGNLIISGNLTVNGTLTYLNVTDLQVEDSLIKLAKDNTANTLDIGFFGKYVATGTKYKGLFNDASDDKFKLFIGTGTEPTTTVDTSASGYSIGTLVANLEGNVTGGTVSGTTATFSGIGEFAGAIRITETATAQRILIGNQDSGGVNKPSIIMGANANLYFGYGDSWSGEGGNATNILVLSSVDSSSTFSGNILPNADSTYNIGANNNKWAEGHFDHLYIGETGNNPRIDIYTEDETAAIADTFADTTTDKSYIYFNAGSSSNDPGYIMHETSNSETNEGVLHLVPSDDNNSTDYVSIHGTDDPDSLKLHTSGLISTANGIGLQLTSDSGTITLNDSISGTTGTFSGQVTIPETPTADAHAASKKYVDDATANVDVAKRLEVTVKNVSGGSLAKGTVVHAAPTASPPSGNVIEVIAADANDAAKMPSIGVLNETIADEAEGEAVMFGAVSGIDTSSFSIGDELYVSETAGEFTATKPTAFTSQVQKIAVVIKSHASNGLIKVFGAGRSNDVPNRVDRDMNFTDGSKLEFGTDSDLEIYHDGTDGYIDNINGELIIQNNSNDKKIIFKSDNGIGDITEYFRIDGNINRNVITVTTQLNDNVPLIFGSGAGSPSIKYDSTATQLFIGGESKFLSNVYFTGNAYFGDNDKLYFGDLTTPDLEIYHDTGNSVIKDNGTGSLYIMGSSSIRLTNVGASEHYAKFFENGAVELMYDNSKKFETTSTGVSVTGNILPSADSTDNIGSTSIRWANVWTDNINGGSPVNTANDLVFDRASTRKIVFNSDTNFGSDNAFLYFNENSSFHRTGTENVRFSIGTFNDFSNSETHSDALDLQGGARLYLNAGNWDSELDTAIGNPSTGAYLDDYPIQLAVNNTPLIKISDTGDILMDSGASGTTAKLIFKSADNVDLSKFIRTSAYYVQFGGNQNEGWQFFDNNNSTNVLQINGGANTAGNGINSATFLGGVFAVGGTFTNDITTSTKFVQTGTSTNLLSGSIKIDATNPTLTLQASVDPGNATIQFLDSSSNVEQSISASSNNLSITTRAGEIKFNTAQTLAATLDTSQNLEVVGSITAPTFIGDLNGTINTLTTAVTQSANNNSTKVATTAYVDTATGQYLPLSGGTLTGALTGTTATFSSNLTSSGTLTVNGTGHVFLGANGQNPKIDMMYIDSVSGAGWDTRIFIGKSDNLPNGASYPTYTAAGGYGIQFQGNSDGAFYGIEKYNDTNYRPVIGWGDDVGDTPMTFRFNGTSIFTIDYLGSIAGNAATFAGNITFGATNPFIQTTNVLSGSGSNGARIRSAVSTAANPTFSNSDDTDTGIFFPSANSVALSTGGTQALSIDSSQNATFAGMVTTNARFNATTQALHFPNHSGTQGWQIGSDSTANGMYIYNENGVYAMKLTKTGNATFSGDITANGGDITAQRFNNSTGNFLDTDGTNNYIKGGANGANTLYGVYGNFRSIGHIYPHSDNTYDLGATNLYWRNVYANNIVFGGVIENTDYTLYSGTTNGGTGTTAVQYYELYNKAGAGGQDYLHFKLVSFNSSEFSAEVKITIPSYSGFTTSYGSMDAGQGIQCEIIYGGLTTQAESFISIIECADLSSTSSLTKLYLKIQPAANSTGIKVSDYADCTKKFAQGQSWSTTAPANQHRAFNFVEGATNINEVLSIHRDQKIGIATNDPQEKLDVAGNVMIQDSLMFKNITNSIRWQFYRDGNDTFNLRYNNGSTWSSNAISVKTNNFVGIGVTDPQARLNTNLSVSGSLLAYMVGTSNTFDANANIAVTHNSSAIGSGVAAGLLLANNNNSNNAISPLIAFSAKSTSNSFNHTYAAIYGQKITTGADTNWNKGDIILATSSGTGVNEVMRITKDSRVGINTNDPQATFEVGGAGSTLRVGPRYSSGGDRDFVDLIAAGTDSKVLSNNERFHIENNAGHIIINPSGFVGINITSPTCPLDVDTTGTLTAKFRSSSGVRTELAIDNTSTNNVRLGFKATPSSTVIDSTNHIGGLYKNLHFQMGGVTKMLLDTGGNLAIGHESPGAKLHVVGTQFFEFNTTTGEGTKFENNTSGGTIQIGFQQNDTDGMHHRAYIKVKKDSNGSIGGTMEFYVRQHSSAAVLRSLTLRSNGYVAILKETPSYQLDVTGSIRATSDVIAFSDRRVKENIVTIDSALNKVTKLRGVTYNRKDIDDKSTKVGVIAQEVLEVLPEVVEKDDEGKYSVAYGNMAGVFIEAIKELKAEVDSLKQEIKELKK